MQKFDNLSPYLNVICQFFLVMIFLLSCSQRQDKNYGANVEGNITQMTNQAFALGNYSFCMGKLNNTECYFQVFQKLSNLSVCQSFTNEEIKSICVLDVAQNTKNDELCELITSSIYYYLPKGGFGSYRDLCYYNLALLLNKSLLCFNMTGGNDSILQDFFNTNGCFDQFGLCTQIKNPDSKKECYKILGHKGSMVCEGITEVDYKDDCYFGAFDIIQNESNCKKMSTQHDKDECYYSLSYYKNNSLFCQNIAYEVKKADCFNVLSDYKNAIISCDSMILANYNSDEKDHCYLQLYGPDESNGKIACGKIKDNNTRNTCFEEIKNDHHGLSLN